MAWTFQASAGPYPPISRVLFPKLAITEMHQFSYFIHIEILPRASFHLHCSSLHFYAFCLTHSTSGSTKVISCQLLSFLADLSGESSHVSAGVVLFSNAATVLSLTCCCSLPQRETPCQNERENCMECYTQNEQVSIYMVTVFKYYAADDPAAVKRSKGNHDDSCSQDFQANLC